MVGDGPSHDVLLLDLFPASQLEWFEPGLLGLLSLTVSERFGADQLACIGQLISPF